jgi:hypothetical protein
VNQIAHTQPDVVKDLLTASANVVHAQLDAAGGDEERERLLRALEKQRDVEDQLREAVREVAQRPSADLLTRVLDDFRRGAIDPEGRQLLKTGRLTRDLPPRDFGSMLEEMSKGQADSPPRRRTVAKKRARAEARPRSAPGRPPKRPSGAKLPTSSSAELRPRHDRWWPRGEARGESAG